MLKHWRLFLLLIMVVGGILSIGLKPQYSGVQIAYVSEFSPAKGILEQGMIITKINGQKIETADEWNEMVKGYSGDIILTVDKEDIEIFVNDTGLGIDTIDIDKLNLDFGLDIKGGTRILMEPKENSSAQMIDQVISTLQTRANIYGLREIKFSPVSGLGGEHYVQIEASGLGRDIVDNLLSKQGQFEAKITKPVSLSDNKGVFELGANSYNVEYMEDGSVRIGDIVVNENDTFTIDDIDFEYVNKSTDTSLLFIGTAYRGEDIELVYSDAQHSGIIPRGNFFEFYFGILVSEVGAERFAKITSGIPSQLDFNSGDYYLKDSRILLYLDGNLVSDLRIASTLGGKVYTTPQITGSRELREDALDEKMSLQTILRSGALPVSLETVSVGVISPTLGKGFVTSALFAGGLAALVVIVITFLRYRKLRVVIPLAFTGLSEVIIILGIAANNDWFIWGPVLILNFLLISAAWWKKYEIDPTAWIGAILIPLIGLMFGWTIDLPVIGGIIAAIGVGVDNMIVIADETLSGKKETKIVYTIKDKIKRAFFIIFGSASTTIAAMIPLMMIGVGLVRGFAITTIIGVLVGILITRPAYAKIVEMGSEKNNE